VLYQGNNKQDILNFINKTLLEANDKMKNQRLDFFNDIVKPPNNLTASENIYNYINKKLTSKKKSNM